MSVATILWDMEERCWMEGAEGVRRMTAKSAVFVFPEPTGILTGDMLWREADVAQRWRKVEMNERLLNQEGDVAVLAYQVTAERGEEPLYEAFCSSTYVKEADEWLRLTHQQTAITQAASDDDEA